jgi:hypothetical protein
VLEAARMPETTPTRRPWWLDARGAVATEYAVTIGVCAVVISLALAALGPPMVASYQTNRATLIAPVP